MSRAIVEVGSWGLVLSGFALLAGCTVQVNFGCQDSGNQYATDDTFQRGCQTCTCSADGTVACDKATCGCEWQGASLAEGQVVDAGDGCNTCTCDPTGAVLCTGIACTRCNTEPPPCGGPDPSCSGQAVCDPSTGTWTCEFMCDCSTQPMPECPPPQDGCFYDGPVCVDGLWQCGDLICSCDGPAPMCGPPMDPGCWSEAVCGNLGWECQEICGCSDPIPDCPPDTFVECDPNQGWVCLPTNATCPGVGMVDCGMFPDPNCVYDTNCHDDGNWYCEEDCTLKLCPDPAPECPVAPPNCFYYAVCTSMNGWACAESCQ